jgi:beta-carotene 3-hydroxylase
MTTPLSSIGIAVVSFVAMEPVTYAVHRWVMHGFGRRWHDSHHRQRPSRFELNDLFPLVFASIVMTMWAIGTNVDGAGWLVWVGVGATAYGVVYATVHDLYIHRRFVNLPRWPVLDRLGRAHQLHHRDTGEPYGLLVPVLSNERRRRLRS